MSITTDYHSEIVHRSQPVTARRLLRFECIGSGAVHQFHNDKLNERHRKGSQRTPPPPVSHPFTTHPFLPSPPSAGLGSLPGIIGLFFNGSVRNDLEATIYMYTIIYIMYMERETETDRQRQRDRERQRHRERVKLCFTPSQPVWIYRGWGRYRQIDR